MMKFLCMTLLLSFWCCCAPLTFAWKMSPFLDSARSRRLPRTSSVAAVSAVKKNSQSGSTPTAFLTCHDDNISIDSLTSNNDRCYARRQLLWQAAIVASLGLLHPPAAAHAQDDVPSQSVDPLDQLGQALSTSSPPTAVKAERWPETSLSPLPPPSSNRQQQQSAPNGGSPSDLEQALQGMQKKRQIDPRTHG